MAAEEKNEKPAWFSLPFYRSLSEQILIAGVPKGVLAMNAVIMLIFIVDFGFWYIIPISLLMHFGAIYLCKGDDQFFDCLRVYINKKNYYNI